MAREISQFDNGGGSTSDFPNGYIIDNPGDGSGTKANAKSNNDLQQFFQKIMINAGISANGLQESTTNGFQLVQALNTLINQESSGMAAAFGTPTGTYIPIIMSGCAYSATGSAWTLTGGWFFYNGIFYYCNPGTGSFAGGATLVLTLGLVDGLPTATPSWAASVSPGAGSFDYSAMVTWAAQVGITALQSKIAIGAWTNITAFGTDWTNGAIQPRFAKDGVGRISCQGQVLNTFAGVYSTPFVFPSGARPSENLYFNVVYYDGVSAFGQQVVLIDTSGNCTLQSPINVPSRVNSYIDISSLSFITS